MLAASDTSPVCNLAIVGRLQLLRSQFGEIWIPGAVKCELDRLPHADALKEIHQAFQDGWIKTKTLMSDLVARALRAALDPGEAEAIALALELQGEASRQIESIGRELDALRTRARFFLSAELTAIVLNAAGE